MLDLYLLALSLLEYFWALLLLRAVRRAATLILTRSRGICVRNLDFFISWAMIFGICIDYRSAESIGIRIVLYLQRQYVASVGSILTTYAIQTLIPDEGPLPVCVV